MKSLIAKTEIKRLEEEIEKSIVSTIDQSEV